MPHRCSPRPARTGPPLLVLGLSLGLIALPGFIAGCGGGGSSSLPLSDPAAGIFAGTVLDQGVPVAGAHVSIQGIEANTVTGADGNFMISDPELAVPVAAPGTAAAGSDLEISVLKEGYEPLLVTADVRFGERISLDILRDPAEPHLTVLSPTGERTFVVPNGCTDPEVRVEGFARLGAPESFSADVVVVLDRSGSTGRDAFDVDGDGSIDTVLEAEISATECFLASLDLRSTRVCIVQFNDSAELVQDFTSDENDLALALESISAPVGGTNYEAAFDLVQGRLEALAANDAASEVPPDEDADPLPDPAKVVVFLSDGIPTSHGVPLDTTDSNITQSAEDRQASIDGARSLGEATGALLFGFSIIPENDSNRPRTTLPQCVAVCGNGQYQNLPDASQLAAALCPLESVMAVTVVNETTGDGPVVASIGSDGFFTVPVPVAMVGPPGDGDPDHTVTNTLRVRLEAFSGPLLRSVERSVTFRLITETDLNNLTVDEVEVAQSSEPVIDRGQLRTPTGRKIRDNDLFDLLTSEFEDAVELYGVETFGIIDPLGGGAATVQLNIDFIFKEACYQSDFGYIVIDPDDPPATVWEALGTAPLSQVLFNSGDFGGSCNTGSIPAGSAHYTVTVPTDVVVAFFIIPNRTLSEYQSNPNHSLKPLFTLSDLNPGDFDQVLTFRTLDGRTAPGPDLTLVTPGRSTIFAFEDLAIARRRSDQDFSDVVFTVSSEVVAGVDILECD